MSNFADVIITNANVFSADESNPHAKAIAVRGDRLVYVGSRAEVQEWRGRGTRVLDGQGNTLLPGFINSHFHLLWGSIELADAQLQEVRTPADLRGCCWLLPLITKLLHRWSETGSNTESYPPARNRTRSSMIDRYLLKHMTAIQAGQIPVRSR